jgi:hypothetical protein
MDATSMQHPGKLQAWMVASNQLPGECKQHGCNQHPVNALQHPENSKHPEFAFPENTRYVHEFRNCNPPIVVFRNSIPGCSLLVGCNDATIHAFLRLISVYVI